jgi:hypothetical protein
MKPFLIVSALTLTVALAAAEDISKFKPPLSSFTPKEHVDPFVPPNYVWPAPVIAGQTRAPVKPTLCISSIMQSLDLASAATLCNGMDIQVGQTYQNVPVGNGQTSEISIVEITEDSVIFICDGKQYESKIKSQELKKYEEKEEAP